MATGDFDGALEQLQARKDIGAWQGDLGVLYAKLGRRDDALREIERLDTLQSRGFGVAYEQAPIYATLGRPRPGLRVAGTRAYRSFVPGELDAAGTAHGSAARAQVLRRRREEAVRRMNGDWFRSVLFSRKGLPLDAGLLNAERCECPLLAVNGARVICGGDLSPTDG